MDNQHYQNNQSSDSFYSYNNNGQIQNSGEQQNTGTYQNTPGGYGSGTYGNTQMPGYNGYGNTDQSGAYQQNALGMNGEFDPNGTLQGGKPAGKAPKKKKERRRGGFGIKLVKCAALALVFGLVAGTAFEGIRLVSGNVFGAESSGEAGANSNIISQTEEGKIEATSTAANYVATDVSDIVEATMPSIVAITNVSETEYQSFWGGAPQKYENESCGSGIIVGQNEEYLYIATNNHVVNGATSLTVTFNDNSTVSAEVKGTDPSTDLAVVKVTLSSIEQETMNHIKVATLGNSEGLRVGEASIAIGNALGYGQSVTTGCISALERQVSISDASNGTSFTAELIQTDAAINPGNSGGALLNATGEVIGINSVKYSDTSVEGIGYAIPISTAAPIIQDLITKEKVDQSDSAFLGVAGVDVTSEVAGTYNMPTGVYVAQVTEGSAAEQAGIQKGDIVTEFDGREITSMSELSSLMEYYQAGSTVEVKIQRAANGEYIEQIISVELGRKN